MRPIPPILIGTTVKLLAELKRRKVYRVGVGYAAFMFVGLQAAELLLSAMEEGEQIFRLLVVLALAGFPVALVLAWLFEVTPEGVIRTDDSDSAGPSASKWQAVWATALVLSTLLVGGTGWWFLRTSSEAEVASAEAASAQLDSKALVVTPFLNLSGNDEDEYFSDGMTDAVITGLARVRGLRVTSRTSSFALKDSPMTHSEIASELGVSSILGGSVRKDGEVVRVDVQLADARDGFEMWTERYERPLSDVFAVQDEIARAIVRVLEVTLAERPDSNLVSPQTTNAMAYDKFLWGDYNRNKRTPRGLQDAIGNYEDAIARDSDYAEAHAGLAHALISLAGMPRSARDELMGRAETAIERALELDPSLASGHAARGILLFRYYYDWDQAEAELRRAVELEPQVAEHRQLLARVLAIRGRSEEARRESLAAIRLDGLSPGALSDHAVVLHAAGDVEGSIDAYDRALQADPSFEEAQRGRGFVLLTLGRGDEARDALSHGPRPEGEGGLPGPGPRPGRDTSPEGPPDLDDILSTFAERRAEGRGVGGAANFLGPLLAINGDIGGAVELLGEAYEERTLEPLELTRALAVPEFAASAEAQEFLVRIGLREAA